MNAQDVSSAVLPLFRSEVQFRILGELFTNPGLELAVGELAERIASPRPTVSHEVARLADAGLLVRRRDGNRTLLQAAMSTTVSKDIQSLLSKTYGPLAAIQRAFIDLPVTYIGVFGSFAARWLGEAGPPPNDVDVLVVGDLDYETLWDITATVSRDLGIEVNAVLREDGAWGSDDSPFAEAVRNGHVVDVIGEQPPAPTGALDE